MDTILCPYCECRVRVSEVDDEGGVCPECGAIITSSHLVEQDLAASEDYDPDLGGDRSVDDAGFGDEE